MKTLCGYQAYPIPMAFSNPRPKAHSVRAWVQDLHLEQVKARCHLDDLLDTAIQKLQNLLRNAWISGQVSGNPYICY